MAYYLFVWFYKCFQKFLMECLIIVFNTKNVDNNEVNPVEAGRRTRRRWW